MSDEEARKAKRLERILQPEFRDLVTTSTGASKEETSMGFRKEFVNPKETK